jgi:nicotinate-nucleotide--dimethylbenzimidazole phosphoribosyltransferase
MDKIESLLRRIEAPDREASRAARERMDRLTKPQGSLGRLEELAVQLAGISRNPRPRFPRKAVLVLAADHGVTVEGVSAYPSAVTPQMVLNFLAGGAAINVLARQAGARVVVADLGVAADLSAHAGLIHRKVAYGTRNMAQGPAMTLEEMTAAVQAGIEILQGEIEAGVDLVATGDMGIGNTTAAAAITVAITGRAAAEVTGRGTGLDDAGLAHKIKVIERALAVNRPDGQDAFDVLCKVGGLEIAGLAGVILGAAAHRVPVVIDGFISGAAALIAVTSCPPTRDYLIAAHRSVEIGHQAVLEWLGMLPLLDLQLRLGEGTGAALAFPLIDAACALQDEMATFEEAGVSEKSETPQAGEA